ncbi:poly(R)-hydroxyalkanoic acid synthase subunit PhaE [Dyella sp. 2HG41-7]|uniref:poly(R)-hydroxyalkanoic acid synthase subunit PhaE n=1 Tax=Dyella sp. 2HG41-7 TaxID=2883239 RepID=UPI001F35B12F|nr:poly(R)-hydroxyalkanoic acid synthase subunit PhaE [Dyella sp. 2HG41-7]
MPDQANDFLKDYQAFAQQSWDAWMRYMQQQGQPAPFSPFGMAATAVPQNDLLTRSLSSLKAYGSWLQQAAGAGMGPMSMGNWQQPSAMQSFLAAFNQPFAQTVAGIDSSSAFGLEHQWQSWLQAMQQNAGTFAMPSQMAAFGITREVQLDQQALAAAMQQYAQINARYQGLLQKVNTQGIARLQQMLSQQAETGKQVESLKALYDLWVDAMEEAYATMAMSDEYREVFGALANAQMHVRKLQQEQTEHMCRELGIPTRSEVNSLGKRLQEMRRELKAQNQGASAVDVSLVDTLQAEIASLKRELAESKATKVHSIERKSGENGKTASPSRRAKATRSATGKRK